MLQRKLHSSQFFCTLIFLWCSSHRALLTTKNSLGPSELKVSKIARFCLFLASSKIRLKSTSESSGPSRDSNSSTSTFILSPFSRYCLVLAMIVLSRAFQIWSSTWICHFFSSYDECELSSGVGGIILLLESGGEFAGELSYAISSCETVQTWARLWRKKRTAAQQISSPNPRRHTQKHSVTTEECETRTTVTSSTAHTPAQDSGPQSDKSSAATKGSTGERPP